VEKILLNKIVELSEENGVLKNENKYLQQQLNGKINEQTTALELRKRLINLKHKGIW